MTSDASLADQTFFQGFPKPTQNWSKLPHALIDALPLIDTLAELKVILYILRHTWGYKEFGQPKRFTLDEFMNGRKDENGKRIDRGIGMAKSPIIAGIRKAVSHGFLMEEVNGKDKARIKKSYTLAMSGNKTSQMSQDKTPKSEPDVLKQDTRCLKTGQRTEKETIERKKDSAQTANAVAPAAENSQPINPEPKRESTEPDTPTIQEQVLTTDKNLPPGVASDKLYLVLPENTFEGPYAPTGTFVKAATGTFMQGEAIPPSAKIIPPAHVRAFEAVKALLDAIGREKLPPGVDEKPFMDLGKKWAKANVDTACLGALIRAWPNANKVAPPLAWTVAEITTFTRYAWGMCQNGITENDIADYVKATYDSEDANGRQFWKGKAIPFGNVNSNVGVWKASRVNEQPKWTYDKDTGKWKEPTHAS